MIHLVLEYAGHGSLWRWIQHHGALKEKRAKRVFGQLAGALAHCHSHEVIHRDIKPENVLVCDASASRVLLSDFGSSTRCGPKEKLRGECGTHAYMPPEMSLAKGYGHAADLWSLGMTLFYMLAGQHPFDDPFRPRSAEQLKALACAGRFEFPARLTKPALDLLHGLLNQKPAARPRALQLAKHPWCAEFYIGPREAGEEEEKALREAACEQCGKLGLDSSVLRESLEAGKKNYLTVAHSLIVASMRAQGGKLVQEPEPAPLPNGDGKVETA